jgi:pimeloyl-ACP methyl ester carboxylesterase
MVDSIPRTVNPAGVALSVHSWIPTAPAADGRAFVLLHGIAATAAAWAPAARALCAAGHRAFAVEFRGHGRSDRPAGGYDLETFATDLVGAIGELGFEMPVVVGHSLGANVILAALTARPELVTEWSGVGLVEGALVGAREQFRTFEDCAARLALPAVDGMPLPRVGGYLRASNPSWSEDRLAAALDCFDVDSSGAVAWRLTAPRYQALLRALWDDDLTAGWRGLDGPALVVAADNGDPAWTDLKRRATERLASERPGVRIGWLPGDHDIHLDRPGEVARLLLETFG